MAVRYSFLFITLLFYTINGAFGVFINQTNTTTIPSTTQVNKLAKYTLEGKSFDIQYMSEIGSRCTDDGFFADKDDCRKFHVCYSGTQSIRWCKEGMLWDVIKIGCHMQNNTSCIGGRKKWGRDEETTTIASRSIKGNYICRQGTNGLFADPSSCSIYHWCVLGILHSSHYCNSGLHFSASASGCVWPKDAECEGQIAPPYPPIECSLGSSGYFPDPYDCSVFHYCNGVKTQSESLLCSAGRFWNSRHENCDWPQEVPECQNACPANYSSQMRFADPMLCSQYIQCVDGRLEQRTCSNNFVFDRITKTCKSLEQAECHGTKPEFTLTTTISSYFNSIPVDNNPITPDEVIKKQRGNQFSCVADGYFGDAQDCRMYHVCVDGREYRSMCAPGLAWESLLRLCMPAHLVGCQTSKSSESSSGSTNKKWLHLFTRSAIKMTTTTASVLHSIFTCAGRLNGYYADPVHCHKFHYCATGWHSVMECDKGLAYSSRDHDCLPIEHANCGTMRQ